MAVHGGNIEEIGRKYNIDFKELIDFSANINPLGISEKVKSTMIKSLSNIERYPDITYFKLKEAISRYENINIDSVIAGNGAAEVIFNIVRGVNPRKALLYGPTFSEYEEALQSIGCNIKYHILKEEKNFNIDSKFIDELENDIDITFVCNPNNPTGVLTSKEVIIGILEKAKKTNTVVVVDESFLDFINEKEKYTLISYTKKYNNLIIVKSLTKFFAMPGIRIGYGICSNIEILNKIKNISIPWSINVVAEQGAIKAVEEKEYIQNTIEYLEKEKSFLYNSLKEIDNIKVFEPTVNFIMFKVLNDINLKEELLKEKILIRSCDNYRGLNEKFYRVAVRRRDENIKLVNGLRHIFIDN